MIKRVWKRLKRSWKKFWITTVREFKETKRMAQIYLKERHDKELVSEANKQLVDLFKIAFLFPISILPGSILIVTILELIARAFRCSIFPTKQKKL